jgi:hypothetical protein
MKQRGRGPRVCRDGPQAKEISERLDVVRRQAVPRLGEGQMTGYIPELAKG